MTTDIIIKSSESNEKWDRVCQTLNGNVFQSPIFFEICKAARGYRPYPLFAYRNKKVIASIMPVEVKVLPTFLGFLSNRWILYGGVLYEKSEEGRMAVQILFRHFLEKLSKSGYLFMEVRNFYPVNDIRSALNTVGFQYYDYLNYTINLTLPATKIWKRMHKNRQRNIKKAEKIGLVLKEAQEISEIESFYHILQEVYQRKRIPLADISLFTGQFAELNSKGFLKYLLVKYKNKIIAGIALLLYNKVGYEWYVGGLSQYAHLRPNDWLIWKTIEYLKSEGFRTFDFCGAGRPEENYGVREFKRRFGGEELNFGRFFYTPKPRLYKMMNVLYNLFSKK